MRDPATFIGAGWNFTNTWSIEIVGNMAKNAGYAFFQWQNLALEPMSPTPPVPVVNQEPAFESILQRFMASYDFIQRYENWEEELIRRNELNASLNGRLFFVGRPRIVNSVIAYGSSFDQ